MTTKEYTKGAEVAIFIMKEREDHPLRIASMQAAQKNDYDTAYQIMLDNHLIDPSHSKLEFTLRTKRLFAEIGRIIG